MIIRTWAITYAEFLSLPKVDDSEMGLEHIETNIVNIKYDYYKVVDEHKFFLSVIKHNLKYEIVSK